MEQKQFEKIQKTLTGGALLIAGAILFFARWWLGSIIAVAGLWMLLGDDLKRWLKETEEITYDPADDPSEKNNSESDK